MIVCIPQGIRNERPWLFAFHLIISFSSRSKEYSKMYIFQFYNGVLFAYGDLPLHHKQYKINKTFTFTFATDISHSTLSVLDSLYVCLFYCCSVTVLHTLLLSMWAHLSFYFIHSKFDLGENINHRTLMLVPQHIRPTHPSISSDDWYLIAFHRW